VNNVVSTSIHASVNLGDGSAVKRAEETKRIRNNWAILQLVVRCGFCRLRMTDSESPSRRRC
jgi:hypothetical protein